jgi:hypothetical protein
MWIVEKYTLVEVTKMLTITELSRLQRKILAYGYVNHHGEGHDHYIRDHGRCPHPDLYPAEILIKHFGIAARMRVPIGQDDPYLASWLKDQGVSQQPQPDGFYWTETMGFRTEHGDWKAKGQRYRPVRMGQERVPFVWREWERGRALVRHGYVWGWAAPVFDADSARIASARVSTSRSIKRLAERGLIVVDTFRAVDVTGFWLTPAALEYMDEQLAPYRKPVTVNQQP